MYHAHPITFLTFLTLSSCTLALPSYPIRRAALSTCDTFNPITSGAFEVQNDAWGAIPGGSSCVELGSSSSDGSVAWSTNFNWGGEPNAIKSFANAQAAGHTP
ncbi:MAG: hypothetical protein Q9223_002814, partial [Gallowayella weberi]